MNEPGGMRGPGLEGRKIPDGKVELGDKLTPEYYDAVIEKVFRPAWLLIGTLNDVPDEGSYYVYDVPTFKTSVLVVRGAGGEIRAFHNFCRHRGKTLVPTECGRAQGEGKRFTCAFHGFTYGLDGELVRVPGERIFINFDRQQMGLTPIPVSVRAGLILCYFGTEPAPDIDAYLGGVFDGFEPYYGDMERVGTFSADMDANWQFGMDSFHEGYHVPFLHHNTLHGVEFDEDSGPPPIPTIYGPHTRGSGPLVKSYRPAPAEDAIFRYGRKMTPMPERDVSGLPPSVNRDRNPSWFVDHVFLFPNCALLNGTHWVSTAEIWPISHNRHRLVATHYGRKARHAGDRIAQAYSRAVTLAVTREDFSSIEQVQEGCVSGAFDYIKLALLEMGLVQRYAQIDRMVRS